MKSFLEEVVDQVISQDHDLGELCFILPSRRAGVYVKELFLKKISKTSFLPQIISIESFIESVSGLKVLPNTTLLFELYEAYLSVIPKKEQDTFASFSSWAPTILQDINEVDRFLIPQQKIFTYLSEIQDLNHWSLESEPTPFVKKYLSFWKSLPNLYQQFSDRLLSKGHATQGLCFREAFENIEHYIQSTPNRHHVFAGFNALNTAEQHIIEDLLQRKRAAIYWDIDAQFLSDLGHAAGHFIRKYKNEWKHYQENPFQWEHTHFSKPKSIQIIGTPKNIGQTKQVGAILNQCIEQKMNMSRTAVVLGNETLLQPTLHSLPVSVPSVNVTMGFPLTGASLSTFFDQLISLHADKSSKGFYYQGVQHLLSHQNLRGLLIKDTTDEGMQFIQSIRKENTVYITQSYAESYFSKENRSIIGLLFGNLTSPQQVIAMLQQMVQLLKDAWIQNPKQYGLELEQLHLFYETFNQLALLTKAYPYVEDIKTLRVLYKELLTTQTLHFQGEPLEGLQLMGMLETRAIDFDTVIITSVNEGTLPAGKQPPTTIPFDVKKQFGLPTFEEKDAIYTYHFYRLLQRAQNIYLIYNSTSEGLDAGEKSRFLYQLQMNPLPQHDLKSFFASPSVSIKQSQPRTVAKTPAIMNRLQEMAKKGISPSSLNQYIQNPIAFFNQRVLGVQEMESVEESLEAATFGTIVHEVLEVLYTPFIGKHLTEKELESKRQEIPQITQEVFSKHYHSEMYKTGKNQIVYEVIKHNIDQFVSAEIKELQKGHTIKIIALEQKISKTCEFDELSHSIRFSGIVDRIDQRDEVLRIIDYKTGQVKAHDLAVMNLQDSISDEKYSKALQVLLYGMMWQSQNRDQHPFEAGIVSFKNLSSGFIRFGIKEKPRALPIDYSITSELVAAFEEKLKQLLLEIFDPTIPFIEKLP
ncbi:MAG: PD-(D/E)XK nuclease family protein [Flavobacteriaceae bacterium]|nr:PD-(D/E)XK nuclease family protein [Flavobacteriaceae bacterium]MDG2314762.1 PD-(D/E)XK nuclease family protein [Flavobacteriaceae bacterium]